MSTTQHTQLVRDFLAAGGRLTHIRRSRGRVLTLAYYRERDSSIVVYAGSMFTPDTEHPTFTRDRRRENNVNAIQRFLTSSLSFENPLPPITRTDELGQVHRQWGYEDAALRDFLANKVVPKQGIYSRDPNPALTKFLVARQVAAATTKRPGTVLETR